MIVLQSISHLEDGCACEVHEHICVYLQREKLWQREENVARILKIVDQMLLFYAHKILLF